MPRGPRGLRCAERCLAPRRTTRCECMGAGASQDVCRRRHCGRDCQDRHSAPGPHQAAVPGPGSGHQWRGTQRLHGRGPGSSKDPEVRAEHSRRRCVPPAATATPPPLSSPPSGDPAIIAGSCASLPPPPSLRSTPLLALPSFLGAAPTILGAAPHHSGCCPHPSGCAGRRACSPSGRATA